MTEEKQVSPTDSTADPAVNPVPTDFDIVVVGGGVNGAGVARDAAGRGLSVLLCEKDDLAAHTSSASTKLIHGGLRYLEYYDFKLVRHALIEREVLLRAAPHIIWPLRFILPHHKELRPRWLIRAGLFLYDNLGGRKLLPSSCSVNLRSHESGKALKPEFTTGFEYSDCWVQDSRLVVLNAMDAKARGCDVRTRTEVVDLVRQSGQWRVDLKNNITGGSESVTARAVVNASGPWVDRTLHLDESKQAKHSVRLVKGSHIVVPKLFSHPYTYIFQNADNRIIFAVPYENEYTLLGTTDMELKGDPQHISISDEEVDYICNAASEYFDVPIRSEQVVWSYSGVRPLYDDNADSASKVTRDYKLHLDSSGAPVLSVYGGKITTFRKLSEEVVDMLEPALGLIGEQGKSGWTETASLPGGDIPDANFDAFLQKAEKQYPWADSRLIYDYARNYGTLLDELLQECTGESDLGQYFGGLLYQVEVDYLIRHEFAQTAEDIIWRRSKKGLQLNEEQVDHLQSYLETAVADVLAKAGGLERAG